LYRRLDRGNEQTVMVGGGDGGTVTPSDLNSQFGASNTGVPPNQTNTPGPGGQISFGGPPPSYRTGIGESLEGQPAYYPSEKR
jgi:spartin